MCGGEWPQDQGGAAAQRQSRREKEALRAVADIVWTRLLAVPCVAFTAPTGRSGRCCPRAAMAHGRTAAARLLRLALALALAATATAFYIPALLPEDYSAGEPVDLWYNKVYSEKTQLPYEYVALPVCKPPEGVRVVRENIGEILRGDRFKQVRSRGADKGRAILARLEGEGVGLFSEKHARR